MREKLPVKISIAPNIFLSSASSIFAESIEPVIAPITPNVDATIMTVTNIFRLLRCIRSEDEAENKKNTRFIPCIAN